MERIGVDFLATINVSLQRYRGRYGLNKGFFIPALPFVNAVRGAEVGDGKKYT